MYKFDWSNFNEENLKEAVKELNEEYGEGYFGCVRVGELCFDINVRPYDESLPHLLEYDLYVGGIFASNSHLFSGPYGYSRIIPDYPYEEAEGGSFHFCVDGISYDLFKVWAEEEFTRYINESYYTDMYLLKEKASAPLKVW